MKFLLPIYSCVQNPWLEGYRPQIPVLCPQLNLLNPPPNKIPGYATGWNITKFYKSKSINNASCCPLFQNDSQTRNNDPRNIKSLQTSGLWHQKIGENSITQCTIKTFLAKSYYADSLRFAGNMEYKREGKRPLWRPRRRRKRKVQAKSQEIEWMWTVLMCLRMGTSGGLSSTG